MNPNKEKMNALRKWCLADQENDHKDGFICNRCIKVIFLLSSVKTKLISSKVYEEKQNDFADVSLVGLDFYRGTTCGSDEPLCELMKQLEYNSKSLGFRIRSNY